MSQIGNYTHEFKIPITKQSLLDIGFILIAETPNDPFWSVRYSVLGSMQFCMYYDEKFVRLQTASNGISIRLEHVHTIEELKTLILLLTGKQL